MKHILLFIVFAIVSTLSLRAQSFNEDFEGIVNMTSTSTGTGQWGLNTRLFSQGSKSDSIFVTQSDTSYLTMTNSVNMVGQSAVYLEFDHICKIEFFDSAYIEVSNNNGTTWQRVQGIHYLGSSNFSLFDRFTELAYNLDWGGNNAITPEQSWWKAERFDISTYVANATSVKVRFVIVDGNNNGSNNRNGWFLDNIKVLSSNTELIPPSISLITPNDLDTFSQSTPYIISAQITDPSAVDTAYIIYSANGSIIDTIAMTKTGSNDLFTGQIPFVGFGRDINYKIYAKDSSLSHNLGVAPALGSFKIHAVYIPEMASTTYSEGFENGFPASWTQEVTDDINWTNITSTVTSETGPDGAFEGTKYMYTEASNNFNKLAVITSANYNLSNIDNPMMTFRYHMFGPDMGSLKLHIYSNGVWTYDVFKRIGEQQSDDTDPWLLASIDLSLYQSADFKFSVEGFTGPGFKSDMAIDDFKIGPLHTLPNDAGISEITNPTIGTLANIDFNVKVKLKNFGNQDLTSANINWNLDGVAQNTTAYSGQLLSFEDSIVDLGTLNLTGGNYTIRSWTDSPNTFSDENLINDTTSYSFYICNSVLSGTYTIDPTASGANNFTSFADAKFVLEQCGINGPVIFNVASGTYNEQIDLRPISGSSATNTITFQSASGDSSTVVITHDAVDEHDNYVVRLNAVSNITFKKMTFEALDISFARVFIVGHNENISFLNNVIKAPRASVDNSNMALIFGVDFIGNNVNINNNLFVGANMAVDLFGDSIAENWNISNNIFDQIHYSAIFLRKAKSVQIDGNTIIGDTSGCAPAFRGITLFENTGTASITNNSILTIKSNLVHGIAVSSCNFDSINHATIANNGIQLNSLSASNILSYGIINQESRNTDIYFNTVRLSGSQTTSAPIVLFDIIPGISKNINIANNIFTNNASGYVYYIKNVDNTLWNDHHNILYNYQSNANFAYYNSDVSTFDNWITISGSTNTYLIDPIFSSTTDLHISNNFINGMATPITGITTDLNGSQRDAIYPDNGAYEFIPSPYDITTLEILSPKSSCGLTNAEAIIVRYKNIGSSDITGFTLSYQITGNTIVSETVTTTVAAGDTLDYQFATTADFLINAMGADSVYGITAWASLTNDLVLDNDTISTSIPSFYTPAALIVADQTITYGTSATFTANGISPHFWGSFDNNDILASNATYVTPILYGTTNYWVNDRGGSDALNISVGSGNNTAKFLPLDPYYKYKYTQSIYKADYFSGKEGFIDRIQYQATSTNGFTVNSTIFLSITSKTEYSSKTDWLSISDFTKVYEGNITVPAGGGWVEVVFDEPFYYNGTDNLVVAIDDNTGGISASQDDFYSDIDSNNNKVSIYYYNDYTNPNPAAPITAKGFSDSYPNTKFGFMESGCYGPRVPISAIITNVPALDAGINTIISPADTVLANTNLAIDVNVRNYGSSTLTSLDIIYSINTIIKDTIHWTGSITSQNTETITIDSINVLGGSFDVLAWVYKANDTIETLNSNDTASITFLAQLNGVYSIGTGSTFDYPNITSVVNALTNVGVGGPCVFNISSGTFIEQISIPEINGVNAINNIIFQGESGDSTLTVITNNTSTSANNYVIKLDGADYFTFQNLTIKSATATYAHVIEIDNLASYNNFYNNVIESEISIASTANCFHSDGENNDYNQIINNHIKNGETAIFLKGYSGSNNEKGTVIKDNFIDNFSVTAIFLKYQGYFVINNNTIINGTTDGKYGIKIDICHYGFDISKNKVSLTPSNSSSFGIIFYDTYGTSTGDRGLVSNNLINSESTVSKCTGFYFPKVRNTDISYNSIKIKCNDTLSRSVFLNVTAATHNVTFFNNILYNHIGHTIDIKEHSGLLMDYNMHYSTGTMAFNKLNSTFLADLAALQALTGKEVHSIFADPMFVSQTDLHAQSSAAIASAISLTVVTDDIDGKPRGIYPTIGAYEVDLLPLDMEMQQILLVPNITNENQSFPISAVVKNKSNITISGFQISYTINGGTPVTKSFTDSITAFAIKTVSLDPFISPAGNYEICVTGITVGDNNATNDTICNSYYGTPLYDASILSIDQINSGCSLSNDTVIMWIKNVGADTINKNSQTGQTTVSFINDNVSSATINTENFNTQINPGDTVAYTFTNLVNLANTTQDDSLFSVTAWINLPGDAINNNDTASTDVISLHAPMDPVFTSPIYIGYATDPLISATASATDSIYWYDYDTSSTELYIGSNYQAGIMTTSDTLYLQAKTADNRIKITEVVQWSNGTGATVNYPALLSGFNFEGLEISNLGTTPINIGGYQINVNLGLYTYNYTFPANTTINGGDVALAVYYNGGTVGPMGSNIFCINSSSSISSTSAIGYWLVGKYGEIVDAFSTNGRVFPSTSGVTTNDFDGSFDCSNRAGAVRIISDNNTPSDWSKATTSLSSFGSFNSVLPQEGQSSCSSNRLPLIINVSTILTNDLKASAIINPISDINLTTNESVTLKVINTGTASQSNFNLGYQINNNTAVTELVSSTIAAGDSLLYTFTQTANLSILDSTYSIKVYTELANDQNRLNDTIYSPVTNSMPTFCISKASSTNYLGLKSVTFGNWNHTDAAGGTTYNDYRNTVTPIMVSASRTYSVILKAKTLSAPMNSYAKVFIDFNRDGDFDDLGETAMEGALSSTDSLITGNINIPYNTLLGPTTMRVVLRRSGTHSSVTPCGIYNYGETQDYILHVMYPIPHDAGVVKFVGLHKLTTSNSTNIISRVRNFGTDPISSIDIKYFVNNGTVNTINYNVAPIAPGDSVDIVLNTLPISFGNNQISAYTVLNDDSNTYNDTLIFNVFREHIANLSYSDDFEASDLWLADTITNQWERGIPNMTDIDTAHSGNNVWAIDLDGNYKSNTFDLLYSPKFAISNNIDSATLKFWHYYITESGSNSDGGFIQYRKNNGYWLTLGYIGDTRATNWYNDANDGINKFSGNSNGWIESTFNFDFTTGEFDNSDTIQFRYNFYSNAYANNLDGWAIDDFSFEIPTIANDIGVVEITNPITTAQTGSPVTVTVKVANFGTDPQSSLDIWYQIGNEPIVNETFTPTIALATLDTISYTFTTTAIAPSQDFIVCAGTSLAGDNYPQNDDKCSDPIIVTIAAIDGGVTAIGKIQEYGGNNTTSILSPVILKVEITNFGVNTLTSFDIEYSTTNGTPWYTETWTGSIETNEVDTFIFATPFNSPIGNYSLCARTAIPNDANVDNDELCEAYIGTGINNANDVAFEVSQNEPNPAIGNVRINYIIPTNGNINFELRNTLGQLIYTSEQASFTGKNTIEVDANNLANGVYYYSVIYSGQRITRKMIVNQ